MCLWGVIQDPKGSKELPLYVSGTQVPIKIWKNGSLKAQPQPLWKGPYPTILSTHTAVKAQEHDSCIHLSGWNHGRKKKILSIPASPWEISDVYSRLWISAILMTTQKIKLLGISVCYIYILLLSLSWFACPKETLASLVILRSHILCTLDTTSLFHLSHQLRQLAHTPFKPGHHQGCQVPQPVCWVCPHLVKNVDNKTWWLLEYPLVAILVPYANLTQVNGSWHSLERK